MDLRTVGIQSPGDMGHSVGAVLKAHGLRVVSMLAGRSPRTRALAAEAGIEPLGSLQELLQAADVVLSIMVPDRALEAARELAGVMAATGQARLFVDCNAVSAATSLAIGTAIGAAGGTYVDASIIGPPPRRPGLTRFYASGRAAGHFAALGAHGLEIRVLGPHIGQASHFKTCYASLTKGLLALSTQALVAAQHLTLHDALVEELGASQPALLQWLQRALPTMPPKAQRWVGEMREHAAAFEALGLSPLLMDGAAELYAQVARTPPGRTVPEERDRAQGAAETVAALAAAMALHPPRD